MKRIRPKRGPGANAIAAAAELVCELNRIGDEMVARGDATGRFDPPYTTIHVGTISGGTARNILPKICTFYWDLPACGPRPAGKSRPGSIASPAMSR